MSKPIILARSPYIVEVNQSPSMGSKIEVFIWNGVGSAPVSPNYVLSKFIAAPDNLRMTYDISSYIREYVDSVQSSNQPLNLTSGTLNYSNWCNVKVKRYNQNTDTTYTLLDTTEYFAFNGYLSTFYEGFDSQLWANNPIILNYVNFKNELTYVQGQVKPLYFVNCTDYTISTQIGEVYTSVTIPNDYPYVYFTGALYPFNSINDNIIITVLNADDVLVETFTIVPQDVCNYKSILWYISDAGVWESTYMLGSSKSNIQTSANQYQLYSQNFGGAYNPVDFTEPEKTEFNKNGLYNITINTNWKSESWNLTLNKIMLSEKLYLCDFNSDNILTYYVPVKFNTNQTQFFKHINDKLINYQLEFEYLKALVYTNM
jgi:hypothetical protein